MPAFRFLYRKQRIGAGPAHDALFLARQEMPEPGWEIIPTYDAKCLVAYIMALNQTHPLKEVKSVTPPSPPPPGEQTK